MTPLGQMVVTASKKGLTRIAWSEEAGYPTSNPYCLEAAEWITAFFEGNVLPSPKLDDSSLTSFQSDVCRSLMEIGWGETTTYGELAQSVNKPKASRAVGSVMAMNPWPLLVPCHRVLQANGDLGNYSAAEGPKTKTWLLGFERHTEHGNL
jgi:methylated-DNA-[protein]-cysteine S-methyltransferase